MGDPSQYITVPTLLRLPIPLQHPKRNALPAAILKTFNVRTNLVQLQTPNRPVQGLQKNKISIVLFVFPDRLFFLKLFYFYYIRVLFSHWPIVFCSTFSPFFLIYLYRG